jgi:hypothetical protein
MQYEAGSPPGKPATTSTSYDNNDRHHHENNDTSPPAGGASNKESLPSLAPATPAEERRTSGFRAVNRLGSSTHSEGPVPMDVDEGKND